MNKIIVIPSKKGFYEFSKKVEIVAKETLAYLNCKNKYIEIYCVSNLEMKKLNKKFRNRNEPTNILSFVSNKFCRGDIGEKKTYIGEIYLAPTFIKNKKQPIPLLVIHGILHLLGYTHKLRNDRIDMEKKEDEILKNVKNYNRS